VKQKQNSYDYIVIGGGSAGCIVAARLAEEQGGGVLLLEAGDPAEAHGETLTADGFKYAFANDDLMWHRMTTSQADCGGRALYAGSGRGMGGSGSVNGMVYTRGDHRDFDSWPEGWHWADLVPAFSAIEKKLQISRRAPTSFAKRFIDASTEAGFVRKDGLNDGDLSGVVGANDMNFSGDARRSSYKAWLHARKSPRLTIMTRASVHRLVFDANRRAIAVECEIKGVRCRFEVVKEAILCAGALETPKLLMISGVGPRREIEAHSLPLVLDAPGIGQNLHDHPNVCLFYRSRALVDFQYAQLYGFDVASRNQDEPRGRAPDTCFVCYAAPASLQQSMQRMVPILALPGPLYRIAWLRNLFRGLVDLAFKLSAVRRFVSGVFGIVVILGKPDSRGSVGLASRDPEAPARIDLAYYRTQRDRDIMLAGVEKAKRIARARPFSQTDTQPLSSGAKSTNAKKIWKWVTAATMTTFHYCGSCRMGDDPESPVDTQLRVKGLRNVRVADASVIPDIPVSALNAPSMMIGYRAADFILRGEVK
jgi:choline dehydrogenase